MDSPKHAYKGKDTGVLLAISTMMDSAVRYENELIPEHANWQPPFFDDIKTATENVHKLQDGEKSDNKGNTDTTPSA